MTFVVMAIWLSAQTIIPANAPNAALTAQQLEEQAFGAIERKDWCEATFLFERANDASPTADYLFNAARAAENANDVPRALALYKLAVGGTRAKEAKQRLAALEKNKKPTQTCVAPVPVVVVEPVPPPPPAVPPPVVAPPAEEASMGGGAIAGIIMVPAGSVLLVGGAVAVVAGVLPLLRFSEAQQALDAAASDGITDPAELAALQQKQGVERAAWEGPLGRPLLIGGVVGASVGLALIGVGIGLWASSE